MGYIQTKLMIVIELMAWELWIGRGPVKHRVGNDEGCFALFVKFVQISNDFCLSAAWKGSYSP
jgi:hypothetical protein